MVDSSEFDDGTMQSCICWWNEMSGSGMHWDDFPALPDKVDLRMTPHTPGCTDGIEHSFYVQVICRTTIDLDCVKSRMTGQALQDVTFEIVRNGQVPQNCVTRISPTDYKPLQLSTQISLIYATPLPRIRANDFQWVGESNLSNKKYKYSQIDDKVNSGFDYRS